MSSFIQTTQQATTQMHDINKKIFSQLKTYTFFIFYDLQQQTKKTPTIIQKMSFSLKDQKPQHTQHQVHENIIKTRQVSLNFYNINNHNDILHSISDIRSHSFQNKIKLIINASEQKLVELIKQFQTMNVDISTIPIIINSPMYKSDINAFLGWKNYLNNNNDNNSNSQNDIMIMRNLAQYQMCSQQWIKSSTEKIDLWRVQVTVANNNGHISKLVNNKLTSLPHDKKHFHQYFLSNFSIGHHASLLINCQQKITTNQNTIGNSFISFVQGFKKFCCIGDKNIKSTTGIVNIVLVDDKGQQIEIMKHLKNNDLSQQQSQADFKSTSVQKKYKQTSSQSQKYKDVVSILLANIGIYQNISLQNSIQGKINDSKIQLLTFQSQKSHRKICSAQGEIKMKLQTPMIDIQIGESLYRLENPIQIRVSLAKKMKVGFHHRMVKC